MGKKFNATVQTFEEIRMGLFKKYGEEKDNGGYGILPENMTVFNEEFTKLIESSADLPDVTPVTFSELLSVSISAAGLMALQDAGLLVD